MKIVKIKQFAETLQQFNFNSFSADHVQVQAINVEEFNHVIRDCINKLNLRLKYYRTSRTMSK